MIVVSINRIKTPEPRSLLAENPKKKVFILQYEMYVLLFVIYYEIHVLPTKCDAFINVQNYFSAGNFGKKGNMQSHQLELP